MKVLSERGGVPLLILLGLTVLAFSGVIRLEFVRFDDDVNIYNNPLIANFSLANLAYFWRDAYQNLYIPLTYNLWGLLAGLSSFLAPAGSGSNPLIYHLANLLVHLGCVTIVFQLLRDLFKENWAAAGGALLFALHPLQVEPVVWATGMKDLLAGFWSLLALWQYVRYCQAPDDPNAWRYHYLPATVFLLCGLLSKPSAAAVPLAAVVLGLYLDRSPAHLVREMIPWGLLVLPFLFIATAAQPGGEITYAPVWWQRPLVAGDAWTFYLAKLCWPWSLGPDYGRTPQLVLGRWWIWVSGTVPYLLLALVSWRGSSWLRLAVGLALVLLLPVSGLIPFDFQKYSTVADRYFYLAMVGPALAIGCWLTRLGGRSKTIVCIILLLLGARSMVQVTTWQDSFIFYEHALAVNPGSWMAADKLGNLYMENGEFPEAERFFKRAIDLKPDFSEAYNNFGVLRNQQGRKVEAEKLFLQVQEIDQGNVASSLNLAALYLRRGAFDKAMGYCESALLTAPPEIIPRIYAIMAEIARDKGDMPLALTYYTKALDMGQVTVDVLSNLGQLYLSSGNFAKAEKSFSRALDLQEDSVDNHNNLGVVYLETERPGPAIEEFQRASQLGPEHFLPFYNLGRAYRRSGDLAGAKAAFRHAVELNSSFAPAREALDELAGIPALPSP